MATRSYAGLRVAFIAVWGAALLTSTPLLSAFPSAVVATPTASVPAIPVPSARTKADSPITGRPTLLAQAVLPPPEITNKPPATPVGPTNSSLMLDLSNMGDTQLKAKQYDLAIDTYRKLLLKLSDPMGKAEVWTRIAEAYRLKGDFLISVKAMEQAVALAPGNAVILTNMGLLYETQNDRTHARQYYERAIAADPNSALALNNLAFILAETGGNLDLALTYARAAQKTQPKATEIIDTIGWIHLRKNMITDAIDEFRTITEESPKNPVYHYHYAMALKRQGNSTDAGRECRAAMDSGPDKALEEQIRQACGADLPAGHLPETPGR